jgi:hypothetical protein
LVVIEGRRKKEEGRRKKEEGREQVLFLEYMTALFLPLLKTFYSLCL